jgi:hypothetical protein
MSLEVVGLLIVKALSIQEILVKFQADASDIGGKIFPCCSNISVLAVKAYEVQRSGLFGKLSCFC